MRMLKLWVVVMLLGLLPVVSEAQEEINNAINDADRVGHESIDITYRYAHLFPTRQTEMADKLDFERMGT